MKRVERRVPSGWDLTYRSGERHTQLNIRVMKLDLRCANRPGEHEPCPLLFFLVRRLLPLLLTLLL